ncbi:phosphoglycerol transferase MdoB-like AlkP superfamily enzyme [Pedobacter cryoconitis]|uniref:Phosphoglycerol transferase MdoB-like AlkP superfamily enzyme n=1 Tax=Pedobacter cryoconitis TaxID=188932 RepID=A0A7W8YUW9_9SPHI|nr:alkaline phosphatase family protein [Pedobacter cryoconitis]MBB5622250.1 phosphoglycerol transferase MdoB-like AlkP superfamily enzyme [Pedobacter cryoconitis]
MFLSIFKGRYSVLFSFFAVFLFSSFLIRTGLLAVSAGKTDFSILSIIQLYFTGFFYDFGVALFLVTLFSIYLLFLRQKWVNTLTNRIITYGWLFLILLISFFSFFAELTFWQEFESRFNFIAVDYLIYTYEVVNNINESYPLPLLIGGVLLLVLLVMFLFAKRKVFTHAFQSHTPFRTRFMISGTLLILTILYPLFVRNSFAEKGNNRYQNELSKAGIYSFFAAFKNNELDYNDFYALLPKNEAFQLIRNELKESNSTFVTSGNSIKREINNVGTTYKPNVIMITVESLSADFMEHFGNTQKLMPVLDSLASANLLFTNMYATGTRTVRGMEALTLAAPPTPGSSVVRREGNEKLTMVGHIFEKAGYSRAFFYGGDGYFDNMNEYFGSNGFDIIDRGRNIKLDDVYETKRTVIQDDQVHFENAWGISDEDLFAAVTRGADAEFKQGKPFYNFVMTTSNHRPFTFPEGKIKYASGSGREGAVRYTDYAIGEFLKNISNKPWYKNTVIIIVADHCASSAGRNEIDINKYHIPCVILNLPKKGSQVIDKMCSQIDIYPTLFSLLGWKYESNLYGKNLFDPTYQPRAVLGTYQKLAYLKQDSLVILGPQQKMETFLYNKAKNEQVPAKLSKAVTNQAIANYQTAYDLFKSGGMHQ